MKPFLVLAIATLYLAPLVVAQSRDESEIVAAVEYLKKALLDGEDASLKEITAEELSYGHSNGVIEDKATFIQRLTSGNSDFVSMELSDQTVRIAGNTAIVRHRLKAETFDAGVPGKPNLSVLLIWQKQNNKWKLLARQATKIQ
jgi:hypothetical protein